MALDTDSIDANIEDLDDAEMENNFKKNLNIS